MKTKMRRFEELQNQHINTLTNQHIKQIMKSNIIWKICCAIFIIMPFITYSSLVTPKNVFEPKFMGMPFTLWLGICICIFLWLVMYVAVLNHPRKND